MQLLVIRHGDAVGREAFAETGEDDALRPLTADGARKMERNARALRRAVDTLDVLAASPLLRAAQTARIVAAAYDDVEITTVPALAPDSPLDDFVAWLRQRREAEVVAAVGHEPHLGTLVTWLVAGVEESRTPLRKGGACLLEFDGRPRPGGARLHWALTPALLRLIAG